MASPAAEALPPTYEEARNGAGQPKAGQPIQMQPMPQAGMNTGNADKVTLLQHLGPNPEWIDCQFCYKRARTEVRRKGEGMQFLTGTLLCLVCICLAPLPCMLHWFEETEWYCSSCKKVVALKSHDSPIQVQYNPNQTQVPSQFPGQPQQQQQQFQGQPQQQFQGQPQQPQPVHMNSHGSNQGVPSQGPPQPIPSPQPQSGPSDMSIGVADGPREAGPLPSKS